MLARRFIAILLSAAMTVMLAGCGNEDIGSASGGSEASSQASSEEDGAASGQSSAEDAGASPDQSSSDATTSEFANLDDPKLLRYMEDSVYSDLESELGEDYVIENVTAAYVPFVSDEYKQELEYNSKKNIYFGYTLSELDQQFQGTRYVFTTDGDGNTEAKKIEAYDNSYDQAMENVAVGTGVILLCVTVSAVSRGVGAAPICAVFTAAAKTGTVAAASAGALSGVVAGAAKAYETGGDMDAAAKEAALKGSEGFKWGAIRGALAGGVGEMNALRNPSNAVKSVEGRVTTATPIPTPRESETAALNKFGGMEQVSYLNGKEVAYGTKGSTKPDIVRSVDGKLEAIEVKNYDLKNNAKAMFNELEREIEARVKNLPEGSQQRVVLDVRGRGYDNALIEDVKQGIREKLQNIYPNIPIDIME